MDAGYGGPVWHASIAFHERGRPVAKVTDEHWLRADRALSNVGDPALGEWREVGPVAAHLRRRASADEWNDRPWGMDLRHTDEGRSRLQVVGAVASPEEW